MEGCTWPSEWLEAWPADVLNNQASATDGTPPLLHPDACGRIGDWPAPSPEPPDNQPGNTPRPQTRRPRDTRRL
jgi:hypothetical protein